MPTQRKESGYPVIRDFALKAMPPARSILGTEHTFLLNLCCFNPNTM